MTRFYDREGNAIEDVITWAKKYEETAYRLVAVDSDGEHLMVSTIWEGFESSPTLYEYEHPNIFETAILKDGHIVEKERWSSEEQALEGHRIACGTVLGRAPRPEDDYIGRIIRREMS